MANVVDHQDQNVNREVVHYEVSLNRQYFLNWCMYQVNHKTHPFWAMVPNIQTLAGHANGAIRLAQGGEYQKRFRQSVSA